MNIINVKNIAIIFSILFSCTVNAAKHGAVTAKQRDFLCAVQVKDLQEVKPLLKDVDLNFYCGPLNISPLLASITRQDIANKGQENNKSTEWIKLFLEYGADPAREDILANEYLLCEAALTNNLEAVNLLYQYGAKYIHDYESLMNNKKIDQEVKNELKRIYEQNNPKQWITREIQK